VNNSIIHMPKEYMSTNSVYSSSYNSGAINSGVPRNHTKHKKMYQFDKKKT
jgi:hypothetical protein